MIAVKIIADFPSFSEYFAVTSPIKNKYKISCLRINSPYTANGKINTKRKYFLFLKISIRTKIINISLIKNVGGLIGGEFKEIIPSKIKSKLKSRRLRKFISKIKFAIKTKDKTEMLAMIYGINKLLTFFWNKFLFFLEIE